MVRALHLLIAGLIVIQLHAQFDALPGANASWTTSFWVGPGYPYEGYHYTYDAVSPDTVYNGTVYKKLLVATSIDGSIYPAVYGGALYDNELGQVSYWEPGAADPVLLYDFDVIPGDTLYDVHGLYPQDVRVFAVDTVTINGTERRRVELECLGMTGPTGIHWIQGIGCTEGLLQMAVCGSVSGLGELVCMTASDTVQWGPNVGGVGDCALALGMADAPEALALTTYPVPAEEQLFVQGARTGARLEVYGSDGRIVLASTAHQGRLDISALLPGVHLLRVTDEDGEVRTARFVKR
ncbi:MAG TPA: T9SS type A sorting domain-containing protein [Flavobacteriales bacterium]|nr:T9SS type A sorting domain-containing protein [Flavobacteriales bacterium]HMR27666.1 T9SS type A sorting domain-containing protein [Flavobacteriales bacterium]